MKINHICMILAIFFLTILSGCTGGETPPPKEKIDAENAIKYLENTIPTSEQKINSINMDIAGAKSKNININGVENTIQNIQQKILEIKTDLNNARLYFNGQNWVLSNQTAQNAKDKLESLIDDFNLATEKLREAFLKYDIQETENTLSYLKNQSQSFKDKVSIADNEGVDITNLNKYIQDSQQYILVVENNLNSAKSELNNKKYDSIPIKINESINEFNRIQNTINQGIKSLQDGYNRSIAISQELLSNADFEIRKTEIYLIDAQNNGADISKFQDRYEQAKTISSQAVDALSSRQFKTVKSKTDIVIKSTTEIENEVLDTKYDTISKNIIHNVSKNVKDSEGLNYIKSAEQSRSNKRYEESVIFVNKAIIVTAYSMIDDEISSLEKFSNKNQINLDLQNIKSSINNTKNEQNIENSLNIIKQTNGLIKDLIDVTNSYIDAKIKIQNVKKLSVLWISPDMSQAEEYLNKSAEEINTDYHESIKLANMATESAKKTEKETIKKIDDNLFLRLIKNIRDLITKEDIYTEKIKINDISYIELEKAEFKPPDINIDKKSFKTSPSIDFQKISFAQPSISGSNINKMKKISARTENIDCSNVKLGMSSYAYITIYNDGEETITNEYVDMVIGRDFGLLAGYQQKSQRFQFSDIIDPKTNRRLAGQLNLPISQSGYSLEGWYNARIMIFVNNKNIYTDDGSIYLSTSTSQCQFN